MKKLAFALLLSLVAWVVLSYVECVANVWDGTQHYSMLNFFNLLF